jgi:toxin ParE1/3/4
VAARRVIKREVARQDLDAIAEYLTGEASLEVGLRFLERAEEAFRKLSEMPVMGSPRDFGNERLKGMRTWLVQDF